VELNPLIPDADRDFATCTIWNVFAERGLGASADQGSAASRTDGVEAFDIPADVIENCETLLTVADNNLDSAFSVFPNPSNGEININITSGLGEGQVQIIDLNGRVVFSQDMLLEGTLNVNASGLSQGVYVVQVSNATVSDTAKLIIR